MQMIDRPYFMMDPQWFYFDEEECKYKLTDQAPLEAWESYFQMYQIFEVGARNLRTK